MLAFRDGSDVVCMRLLCLVTGVAGWWCAGVAPCQTPAPPGALSTEAAKEIDTRIEALMDQLDHTGTPSQLPSRPMEATSHGP